MNRLVPAVRVVVGIVRAIENLAGYILRHVSRPSLGGVEANHPEGMLVLSRDKVPENSVTIGLGNVSL